MKARVLFIAALLAGGFYYFTSVSDIGWPGVLSSPRASSGPLWRGPDVAKSAGLGPDELNNIDIYSKAHDAIVNITSTVYRRNWFMELYPQRNSGSGFFVNDKGHILTNWHVVEGSLRGADVVVTLANKKQYKAEMVSRDPRNDLALIKVVPSEKIEYLRMGDSDHVQVGQKVLAIGNPFGFQGTMTTGIVSSVGRTIQDETERELEGLIQTDAAINPGNSGGPLLDSQGSVIGINTAIYGPGGNIGIGFAMPIAKAKLMLDDFEAGRKYEPPRLGVTIVYVSGDWAEALGLPVEGGCLVQAVEPGSAAERTGIRGPREIRIVGRYEVGVGGDFIMEIDGRPCDRPDAIGRIISRRRAGDVVTAKIFRDRREQTIKITLGKAREEAL